MKAMKTTVTTTATTDPRRRTEVDPDYQRLASQTEQRLHAAIARLCADLRSGRVPATTAQSVFIHTATSVLEAAYTEAHAEGQRDYWQRVSARPHQQPLVAPDEGKLRHRLGFYAPSVAKMAHEALLAHQATLAGRTLAEVLPERAAHRVMLLGLPGGGQPPGYDQARGAGGKWAPGNGRADSSSSSGAGEQHGTPGGIRGALARLVGRGGASDAGAQTTAASPVHALGKGVTIRWQESEYEGRAALHHLFGREVSDQEIAALVGARPGDHITVDHVIGNSHVGMRVDGAGYWAIRSISDHLNERGRSDGVQLNNVEIHVTHQGEGIGTDVFARQVAAASALGVRSIEARCERDGAWFPDRGAFIGHMNGFYTWPRLGYDGSLAKIGEYYGFGHLVRSTPELAAAHVKTVRDIMRLPSVTDAAEHGGEHISGAQWWLRNGVGFYGSFDLTPGSRSMQTLEAYLHEKGKRMPQLAEPAAGIVSGGGGDGPGEEMAWTADDEAAAIRAWAILERRWRTEDERDTGAGDGDGSQLSERDGTMLLGLAGGGQPVGYDQNRGPGGRWAPGDGRQEAGDGAGGTVSVGREAGAGAGAGRAGAKAGAGGAAGGGRASYHVRQTDAQGNVIHEEHHATLARVNEYASKQGIAGKLTTAHFQTDAEKAAAKAARDAAKAKRDAAAMHARAVAKRDGDHAAQPRQPTVEELKAAAEARVKTAETNVRRTVRAFNAAEKAAAAKRIANADEITRVSQERHDAFIASHTSYTAAREAIAEERAIAKGEAAKSKTAIENYAKMRAAKQPMEEARAAYEEAKVTKDASEAHAQALQNRYYDEWRQAHPNASPYGTLDAIRRAHPDYKAADTQRWQDHRAFDKAQSAMWRAERKFEGPRDQLAGKISDADIRAHPLHAGVQARLEAADAKLGDLTGDTAKRAAFDAREAAKRELKDAQQAYKHPTWKYTLHSEPTHHASYTSVEQWPAGALDAARSADKAHLDQHEGDRALAELGHAQGFDGKPDVVTEAELEGYAKKGEVELWRGDTNNHGNYTDDLMMGEYHPGLGIRGSGTYAQQAEVNGHDTARSYAKGGGDKGLITRMTIKKDARVITLDDLQTKAHAAVQRARSAVAAARARGDSVALKRAETLEWLALGRSERGNSRYAVALGYDAIRVNGDTSGNGQWIILNRTALRFSHQVRGE